MLWMVLIRVSLLGRLRRPMSTSEGWSSSEEEGTYLDLDLCFVISE